MSENNDDRRNELCTRFRKSLTDGSSSQYFDEDDLIEIFDYAGDLNDDYLRFEVLLCGARYYPDSIPLRERRALLYANYGDDLSAKYLEDNADRNGALWDIARLRNASPMGSDAAKALEDLLRAYSEFDDEEVIQFVDLASALGQTDWLLDRLDALRSHVTYLPTLLFEIAVMLEMENRYEEAIRLLEELTDLEPYNEQYWFMLAQEYDLNNNANGALQALDLALAILPDDKAMRFYHARLLARNELTRQRAVDSLEALASDFPEDTDISRFLAALYVDGDHEAQDDTVLQKAARVLSRCFSLNPGDRKLATDLLATEARPTDEIIDSVVVHQSPCDVSEWVAWADELHSLGAYDKAIAILLYCENKIGKTDMAVNEALIIDYFMLKDFGSVCRRFESQTVGSSTSSPDNAALLFSVYAISLVKTGRYEEAQQFCNMILKLVVEDGPDDISYALRRIGTGVVMTDIIARLKSRKHTDWQSYDPLGAWANK